MKFQIYSWKTTATHSTDGKVKYYALQTFIHRVELKCETALMSVENCTLVDMNWVSCLWLVVGIKLTPLHVCNHHGWHQIKKSYCHQLVMEQQQYLQVSHIIIRKFQRCRPQVRMVLWEVPSIECWCWLPSHFLSWEQRVLEERDGGKEHDNEEAEEDLASQISMFIQTLLNWGAKSKTLFVKNSWRSIHDPINQKIDILLKSFRENVVPQIQL
jgi:hypothetical protein